MSLTAQEQLELDSLRKDLGVSGEFGVPEQGYVSPAARKTATELGVQALPMIGSMAATALAPEVGIPARMLLSGGGAGIGEALKQGIETFGLNKTWEAAKALPDIAKEAALGAAAEGVGQVVGRGLSKGADAIMGTSWGQRIFGQTAQEAADLANKQEIQRLLSRQGTTLGIQEAAPSSTLFKLTERISRIGPAKAAEAKDIEFKNALSTEVNELADTLTQSVLSRSDIGAGLITAQYEGKNALYDSYGKGLEAILSKNMGAKLIPTVDMQPVINKGTSAINEALKLVQEGGTARTFLGSKGLSEATSVSKLKPEMTFAEANEARKLLLKKQRTLEKGSPEYSIISDAVGEIQIQMDAGAKALSPKLFEEYTALTGGYKQSIKELEPKLLATASRQYPDKIADNIINAKSVDAWTQTQAMLNRAKSLGVNTEGLSENIQRAYLEKTFADGGLTNISNKLKDKAFSEQFNAVLPTAVQNRAKVVAQAGALLGQRGKAIDLATAGLLAGASTGAVSGLYSGDTTTGFAGAGGGVLGLLLAPKIAARIAYSPALTDKLLSAAVNSGRGNTAAYVAKMTALVKELQLSANEPTAIKQPTAPQSSRPSQLSSDEETERQRLRKELGM
jgi:hypothetical protein